MDFSSLGLTLPLLLAGMGGSFLVTGILIAVVYLMGRLWEIFKFRR